MQIPNHASLSSVLIISLFGLSCSSNGSEDSSDGGGNKTGDGNDDSQDENSGASGGTNGAGSGGSSNSGAAATGGQKGNPPPLAPDCTVFPADNPWNADISALPVHSGSSKFVASVGADSNMHPDFGTFWDNAPIGIPYVVVDSSTDSVGINYVAYGNESDAGPFPIPLDALVEGGADGDGDRHVIAVDTDACKLYEIYRGFPQTSQWDADSGAEYDLSKNDHHPEGCTSADAAGLPIFPGLVRYDEVVEDGEINHALRFTVVQSQKAYIFPARHFASSNTDPNLPPMGLRFRMKANYDCSSFSSEARVICTALKKYGMIMADNGSNWYLSGAHDPRWNDDALGDLKQIPGNAFEVVDTGDPIVTESPNCSIP